ncbi:MAG: hypothetical protein COA83_05130 [Methylophaga sp.]|nr:MAG: hypothetical protein COA83_05130 [Methylophaga sp.]
MLFSQDLTLHIHDLPHSHDNYFEHNHSADGGGSYHNHISKAHFDHGSSYHDHHNGFILEFDVSSDGILKSITNNPLVLALLSFMFALVLSAPSRLVVQRYQQSKTVLYKYYLLSPPLRAPPQYF